MNLGSYFDNLFSSSSTEIPDFAESNVTSTYSVSEYQPVFNINLDKIIAVMEICEKELVQTEEYEKAAEVRDRIKVVKENKNLFLKLFDLKFRALKDQDYKFASKIQRKINSLLKGKRIRTSF